MISEFNNSISISLCQFTNIVLLGCVLYISGCAFIGGKVTRNQSFSEHVARANDMEEQGRLGDALDHWRIATAIYPDAIEANERARSLEDRINVRVSELIADADKEVSKGHFKASGQLLFSALSLQPDNEQLIKRVSTIKQRAALEKVPATPSQAEPGFNDGRQTVQSPFAASEQAETKFQLGVELFGSDKARAKQLFLETLELNPTHLRARAYLQILVEQE